MKFHLKVLSTRWREHTGWKTSQTWIRHHCSLWWMMEKLMVTREAVTYSVLPMVQVSIKDNVQFNSQFSLMGNHEWNLLVFFRAKVWESKVKSKMHGIDVCKFSFKKRLGVTNQECYIGFLNNGIIVSWTLPLMVLLGRFWL